MRRTHILKHTHTQKHTEAQTASSMHTQTPISLPHPFILHHHPFHRCAPSHERIQPPRPRPKIIKKKIWPQNSPAPFRGGEDELMNVVGLMWMRGEQLKSSLLSFSLQIQRENWETEIVSGMEKKKTPPPKIYLISIRETYFEGQIKTKEPPASWDLSHAESRTFRPFEDKTLAQKKKMEHIWNFRGEEGDSYLGHFSTYFRDLIQIPVKMRWIYRLIINIPMWRADPHWALFCAMQCMRLFNRGYALIWTFSHGTTALTPGEQLPWLDEAAVKRREQTKWQRKRPQNQQWSIHYTGIGINDNWSESIWTGNIFYSGICAWFRLDTIDTVSIIWAIEICALQTQMTMRLNTVAVGQKSCTLKAVFYPRLSRRQENCWLRMQPSRPKLNKRPSEMDF